MFSRQLLFLQAQNIYLMEIGKNLFISSFCFNDSSKCTYFYSNLFFVRGKAWSKTTFILLFSSVLVLLDLINFHRVLFSAIEDTQYGDYAEFHEGGSKYN